MAGVEHLLRQAEAAERLADLVSYAPDKRRLREQAETLRMQAKAATAADEPRSFRPKPREG